MPLFILSPIHFFWFAFRSHEMQGVFVAKANLLVMANLNICPDDRFSVL